MIGVKSFKCLAKNNKYTQLHGIASITNESSNCLAVTGDDSGNVTNRNGTANSMSRHENWKNTFAGSARYN